MSAPAAFVLKARIDVPPNMSTNPGTTAEHMEKILFRALLAAGYRDVRISVYTQL